MSADPWRDLAAYPSEPDDPASRNLASRNLASRIFVPPRFAPSPREYADAWRDFDQQPGARLSEVWTGGMRHELRTAEQQAVAVVRHRLLSATVGVGGRTFTWERVNRSTWPGVAETISRDQPGMPVTMLGRQTDKKDFYLRQLVDETGAPVLYTGGRHFERSASAYIKFPGHRWLEFPVRGTKRANAIMTAVDQAGNKVTRYRLVRDKASTWTRVEITVHPDRELTDELTLVVALSAPFLRSYFNKGPSN